MDVEINYDKKTARVSNGDKTKIEYTVSTAPGGFIFYMVTPTAGPLPADLSGRFTSLDKAVDAVKTYLKKRSVSHVVGVEKAVERNKKKRLEENVASAESEDS